MAPVYEAVPKEAPTTALNCPMIVVEALTVSEPDDVALPKSVLPVSVVDAMSAERLALSAPPMLSAPPTVDDAVTARADVVAEVAERLSRVTRPVLETEKSVVVAEAVEDAMRKRLVVAPSAPFCVATVSCASGEEVPMPKLPVGPKTPRCTPPV